jgi:hypothetical protein
MPWDSGANCCDVIMQFKSNNMRERYMYAGMHVNIIRNDLIRNLHIETFKEGARRHIIHTYHTIYYI